MFIMRVNKQHNNNSFLRGGSTRLKSEIESKFTILKEKLYYNEKEIPICFQDKYLSFSTPFFTYSKCWTGSNIL
jgi:hypothetical protein